MPFTTMGLLTPGYKLTIVVTSKIATSRFGLPSWQELILSYNEGMICNLLGNYWKDNKLQNTQNYWLLVTSLVTDGTPCLVTGRQ